MGPGIFATLLAGLVIDYPYMDQPYSFEFDLTLIEPVGSYRIEVGGLNHGCMPSHGAY